jgi:acyl-CoA synthetase (AMP-forming)/AMP-acid ligase II
VGPDDIADILFTSGTTGRSKGAMASHRQTLGMARGWADRAGLRPDDRYLIVNPFFHSFGYKAGYLACLLSGALIVPQPVFDAATVLDLVEHEQITVLPGPPAIYQTLLDDASLPGRDLSSLRLAVTGAAMVPQTLIRRMGDDLRIDTVLTAYGLTEAPVVTMCTKDDDDLTVAKTCGRPLEWAEVRTLGPDGDWTPAGVPGEVLIRGPFVMRGYLDDPASTTAAIDAEGWLHTGDVGVLDDRGYLRITDRITDMFTVGGFNVYPAELEQVITAHPAVRDCAVIGVPDGRLGEVGRAYVCTRQGSALDAEELIAYCRERLANFKVPRSVVFVDELPRNAGGKVVKTRLRHQALTGQ